MPATAEVDVSQRRRRVKGVLGGILGAAALGVGGGAVAEAQTVPKIESGSTVTQVDVTKINGKVVRGEAISSSVAKSGAQITVLSNIIAKGTPRVQVERARKQKRCKIVDGSKNRIYTEGWNTSGGRAYGRDTRKSEFCRIAGKWVRTACGNSAFGPGLGPIVRMPKKPVPGTVVWVKDMAKASISVSSEAKAKAWARCEVDGAGAYAEGSGHGKASASARFMAAVKSRGGVQGFRAGIAANAKTQALASAGARAEVNCLGSTGKEAVVIQEIADRKHILVGGRQEFCALIKNADPLRAKWSAAGNLAIEGASYLGNEQGEVCTWVKAGPEADEDPLNSPSYVAINLGGAGDIQFTPVIPDLSGGPGAFSREGVSSNV